MQTSKPKPGTPSNLPTKSIIFTWLKQIIPDCQKYSNLKVQNLGTGVLYCRIINNYFPNSINLNRLNIQPKNQYEYIMNLKLFQNALMAFRINIPFDVNKIAQLKFLQNWQLVNTLYKNLVGGGDQMESSVGAMDDNRTVISNSISSTVNINNNNKYTPKKSFEMAFPSQSNQQRERQNYQFNPHNLHQIQKKHLNNQIIQSNHYQNHQQAQNSFSNINNNVDNNFYGQNMYSAANNVYSNYSALISQGNMHFGQIGQNNTHIGGTFNNNGLQQNINMMGNSMNMTMNKINSTLTPISLPNNIGNTTMNNLYDRPALAPRQILPLNVNVQQTTFSKPSTLLLQQQTKCWSVGKLPSSRQSSSLFAYQQQHQQTGKYSVNSHLIQNNYNAIIDRVKEILLKASHDIQKIRQIKMLFNIPLNEEVKVKVQEDQNTTQVVFVNQQTKKNQKDQKQKYNEKDKVKNKENQTTFSDKDTLKICSKQTIQSNKNIEDTPKPTIPLSARKSDTSALANLTNLSDHKPQIQKHKQILKQKVPQSSGKKIKNNFFGEGLIFRK